MKKLSYIVFSGILSIIAAFSFVGCGEKEPTVVYDATVEFANEQATITLGEILSLDYTASKEDAPVYFTSSDPSKVRVNSEGKVYGVDVGAAEITAWIKEGSTAKCTVTVSAQATPKMPQATEDNDILINEAEFTVVDLTDSETEGMLTVEKSGEVVKFNYDAAAATNFSVNRYFMQEPDIMGDFTTVEKLCFYARAEEFTAITVKVLNGSSEAIRKDIILNKSWQKYELEVDYRCLLGFLTEIVVYAPGMGAGKTESGTVELIGTWFEGRYEEEDVVYTPEAFRTIDTFDLHYESAATDSALVFNRLTSSEGTVEKVTDEATGGKWLKITHSGEKDSTHDVYFKNAADFMGKNRYVLLEVWATEGAKVQAKYISQKVHNGNWNMAKYELKTFEEEGTQYWLFDAELFTAWYDAVSVMPVLKSATTPADGVTVIIKGVSIVEKRAS